MNISMTLNKITRLTVLLMACLAITSCSDKNGKGQIVISKPTELCVKGVVYYSFGHGKAPAYKTNGNLILCNGE